MVCSVYKGLILFSVRVNCQLPDINPHTITSPTSEYEILMTDNGEAATDSSTWVEAVRTPTATKVARVSWTRTQSSGRHRPHLFDRHIYLYSKIKVGCLFRLITDVVPIQDCRHQPMRFCSCCKFELKQMSATIQCHTCLASGVTSLGSERLWFSLTFRYSYEVIIFFCHH